MTIDPEAFTLAEPRVLIGPGERALVFSALMWGRPERRDRADGDPVQDAWGGPGHMAGLIRQAAGFTAADLTATAEALQAQVDAPSGERALVRDTKAALAIVQEAANHLTGASVWARFAHAAMFEHAVHLSAADVGAMMEHGSIADEVVCQIDMEAADGADAA